MLSEFRNRLRQQSAKTAPAAVQEGPAKDAEGANAPMD